MEKYNCILVGQIGETYNRDLFNAEKLKEINISNDTYTNALKIN